MLEYAGGYDSDVRLLRRLRVAHLSKAAIVPSARFYHNQTKGVLDFSRKWTRRVVFYAGLSDDGLAAHFVEQPTAAETRGERVLVIVKRMARSFLRPPIQLPERRPARLAGSRVRPGASLPYSFAAPNRRPQRNQALAVAVGGPRVSRGR